MSITLNWGDSATEGTVRSPHYAVWVPTAGIVMSELLVRFGTGQLALWTTVLTLLYCALAPMRFDEDAALYRAFALVPLLRLVGVAMPVFVSGTVYWLALVYAALLPGVFLAARSNPSIRPTFRPRLGVLLFIPAIVVGALLARIEYALAAPSPIITEWTVVDVVFFTLVMFVLVGFVEELLFRGILQRTLEAHLGRWPGLLLTSVVFGLLYASPPETVGVVFATGVGLFVGLVYDWTDSLVVVTTVRGTLNVFVFAALPVSGPLLRFVGV